MGGEATPGLGPPEDEELLGRVSRDLARCMPEAATPLPLPAPILSTVCITILQCHWHCYGCSLHAVVLIQSCIQPSPCGECICLHIQIDLTSKLVSSFCIAELFSMHSDSSI